MEERRQYPRLAKKLPVRIEQPAAEQDRPFATEIRNLSANGLLCSSVRSFDLMTTLRIRLLLPPHGPRHAQEQEIHCEGVVVRTEKTDDDHEHPYQIAVFFHRIGEHDKQVIQSYVSSPIHKG